MTPPSTGRGIGLVLGLSTLVTVIIALPVLLNPDTFIFGVETVGRHYDPFVVMQHFTMGGALGVARQPLVDDLGAWLANGIGPVAAYNVIVLATFPATAAATYALARFLTGVHRSSLVAALAFAFAPVHVAHAAYHPHIAQVQWIPLYLLALLAAVDRPSPPRLAWLGAAVAALVLSNYYGALTGALVTPAAMIAYWGVMPRERRTWWGLAAPSLLLTTLCLLTYAVLRIAHPSFLTEAWQPRNPPEALVLYSAQPEAYLLPPVDHAVVGPLSRRIWVAKGVKEGLLEQQLSLGVGLIGLAALGLWRSVQGGLSRVGRRAVLTCAAIGTWAYVLSLMPGVDPTGQFGSGLRASLTEILPMFRAYARVGIVVALAVAIIAGVALDDLLTKWRSGSVTTRRIARAAAVCLLGMTVLEVAPIPWRARDVLPTQAHRWLTEQGEAVRTIDCTRFSLAEQSVPWLLRSHAIEFLWPPFEECGDPLLVESMMARGFTHLIVRTSHDRNPSGIDAAHGFSLLRRYPDSRVYRVPSGVPVATREVEGFYPWEREDELRRWMGQEGRWQVRNLMGRPVLATLRVELNAFERTRTLDVRLADVSIQLNVDADRRAYSIGPFLFPAGDSELAFRGLERATRPRDVERSVDSRPLTIMFGAWHWIADAGVMPHQASR
jgi:hypothetical protein